MRNSYETLAGNSERDRPWSVWEYNIKMYLKEVGCEDVVWIKVGDFRIE
jgi:hypothetical protein